MATARKLKVIGIETVRPDVRVLELSSDEPIGFLGGKWLMINSHRELGEGKLAKRAYSILSSDADQRVCKIAVKRVPDGPCSNYLHDEVQPGDLIEYSGPYGKLFHIYEDDAERFAGRPLLIAAADTGITAALGLASGERARPFLENLRLLWFVEGDDYFLDPAFVRARLPEAVRARFAVHHIAPVGVPERMDQAREILESYLRPELFRGDDRQADPRPGLSFLCGDGHVIYALRTALLILGVDQDAIRTDPFFNNTDKKNPPKPAVLRSGYTTGACSAAAAKAATRALLAGRPLRWIRSILPNGQPVDFALKSCVIDKDLARVSIVKDAGDDPDCTHLAELVAEVRLSDAAGVVSIHGGAGVAQVTRPGLGLEVGTAAINPVPRKNIGEMVRAELEQAGNHYGAEVTISVPRGEELALETTNARLGLVGGISILGTTGIVKPYSTAAFRTSVVQAIDVARERGLSDLVLTTGGKSEQYAMERLPHLSQEAFIQVGDFVGVGVKHAYRKSAARAIIFGMMGKLSKMADGVVQTHQAGSRVNMELLAQIAAEAGASSAVQKEILAANTGRHVLEICQTHGLQDMASLICKRVSTVMLNYALGKGRAELTTPITSAAGRGEPGLPPFEVWCFLTDFDGTLLGQFPRENQEDN